jgi:hypothetical protein
MCEFKVDLNGDAVEDLTYRITFDERDEQGKQRYVVRRIRGAQAVDPHGAGTVLTQGTTGESVTTPSGVRAWAGGAGDPFWIRDRQRIGHVEAVDDLPVCPRRKNRRTTCSIRSDPAWKLD